MKERKRLEMDFKELTRDRGDQQVAESKLGGRRVRQELAWSLESEGGRLGRNVPVAAWGQSSFSGKLSLGPQPFYPALSPLEHRAACFPVVFIDASALPLETSDLRGLCLVLRGTLVFSLVFGT